MSKSWHMQTDADDYLGDKKRIRDIVRAHDYDCTVEQAEALWDRYSQSMAAGWMILPEDDDDLWACISIYIVEDDE